MHGIKLSPVINICKDKNNIHTFIFITIIFNTKKDLKLFFVHYAKCYHNKSCANIPKTVKKIFRQHMLPEYL